MNAEFDATFWALTGRSNALKGLDFILDNGFDSIRKAELGELIEYHGGVFCLTSSRAEDSIHIVPTERPQDRWLTPYQMLCFIQQRNGVGGGNTQQAPTCTWAAYISRIVLNIFICAAMTTISAGESEHLRQMLTWWKRRFAPSDSAQGLPPWLIVTSPALHMCTASSPRSTEADQLALTRSICAGEGIGAFDARLSLCQLRWNPEDTVPISHFSCCTSERSNSCSITLDGLKLSLGPVEIHEVKSILEAWTHRDLAAVEPPDAEYEEAVLRRGELTNVYVREWHLPALVLIPRDAEHSFHIYLARSGSRKTIGNILRHYIEKLRRNRNDRVARETLSYLCRAEVNDHRIMNNAYDAKLRGAEHPSIDDYEWEADCSEEPELDDEGEEEKRKRKKAAAPTTVTH